MISALEALLQSVEAAELDCDDRDLADILWLASWMAHTSPGVGLRPGAHDAALKSEGESCPPSPDPEKETPRDESLDVSATTRNAVSTQIAPTDSVDVFLPRGGTGHKRQSGKAIHAPAAPALPSKLSIARTLRPVMRRIPSRTMMVSDSGSR